MRINRDDDIDPTSGGGSGVAPESALAPFLALDRLLRYARSEALSQKREKAASLIEAAIMSLSDTTAASRH